MAFFIISPLCSIPEAKKIDYFWLVYILCMAKWYMYSILFYLLCEPWNSQSFDSNWYSLWHWLPSKVFWAKLSSFVCWKSGIHLNKGSILIHCSIYTSVLYDTCQKSSEFMAKTSFPQKKTDKNNTRCFCCNSTNLPWFFWQKFVINLTNAVISIETAN